VRNNEDFIIGYINSSIVSWDNRMHSLATESIQDGLDAKDLLKFQLSFVGEGVELS